MSRIKDLTGREFGGLTVIKLSERTDARHNGYWLCKCRCGETKIIRGNHLVTGVTKSCGCRHKEYGKHGMKNTPTYRSWTHMLQRCENEKQEDYFLYGKRGIKVCPEWHKFLNFMRDMGIRPTGKSLDRKDNDGDYNPENCRWATSEEQQNNRRNNHIIEYGGHSGTITQIARENGMAPNILRGRIWRGISVENAMGGRVDGRTS